MEEPPEPSNDRTMMITADNESLLRIFGDTCLHSYAEQREAPARQLLVNKVVSWGDEMRAAQVPVFTHGIRVAHSFHSAFSLSLSPGFVVFQRFLVSTYVIHEIVVLGIYS